MGSLAPAGLHEPFHITIAPDVLSTEGHTRFYALRDSYVNAASGRATCSHKMAAVARMSSFRSVSCFSLDMRPTPNLERMVSACKDAILRLVSEQRQQQRCHAQASSALSFTVDTRTQLCMDAVQPLPVGVGLTTKAQGTHSGVIYSEYVTIFRCYY